MRRLAEEWGLDLIGVALAWLLFAVAVTCAEPYQAHGIRIIDGDTIHAESINLGWGVTLNDQTVRAAGFDAWESNRRRFGSKTTDDEITKGKAATAAMHELIQSGTLHLIPPAGKSHGVYGRLSARFVVRRDGETVRVADWMRERGHVRK